LRAGGRTGLRSLFPLEPEADESADLAANLDGLLLGQVAQVLGLQFAVGVLVDGQRIDHADGAAVMEPLKFLDDLTVEVGVAEPQNDELYWSDRHRDPFACSACQLRRERPTAELNVR